MIFTVKMGAEMGKSLRLKKFTPKAFISILFAIILVGIAEPHPEEAYYIAGLLVVGIGEIIRLWAAGHLRKNEELTTTGPYSFVKNPLYIGTFLITTGLCVMAKRDGGTHIVIDYLNWGLLVLFILTFLVYYIPYKRKREGDRLREIFGEPWEVYDKNVPDYFPRLTPFRHPASEPRRWSFQAVCENSEQWTGGAVVALAVAISFNDPMKQFIGSLF